MKEPVTRRSGGNVELDALGEGTFRGGEGTSPAVGEAGRDEAVAEYRVEVVVPAEKLDAVVEALRRAHPYEEPAFDVYERIGA